MNSLRRQASLAAAVAVAAVIGSGGNGRTQNASYERMAPVSRYVMADRQEEIELARSAAPAAISLHAAVFVLGPRGYQAAETGSNGFTCLVERSWMSPFDSTDFWNWKMRGPICYNPPASRTIMRYTFLRTDLALSGLTKSQMLARIEAALNDKQLPSPEPGSMSYMMAKGGYLGDGVGAWMPHLMFYAPKADGANDGESWGADVPGSPIVLDTSRHVMPEPETIFMIPVAHWSDGTSRSPT